MAERPRRISRRAARALGLSPAEQARITADLGPRAAGRIHALSEKHKWTVAVFLDVYEIVAHAHQDGRNG